MQQLCKYATGKCKQVRTRKKNGDLHTLCEYHRMRGVLVQRKVDAKRKKPDRDATGTTSKRRARKTASSPSASPTSAEDIGVYGAESRPNPLDPRLLSDAMRRTASENAASWPVDYRLGDWLMSPTQPELPPNVQASDSMQALLNAPLAVEAPGYQVFVETGAMHFDVDSAGKKA